MDSSPRLTVQGLLDEKLMAGARVVSGDVHLDRMLDWVLPLSEVTGNYDDLSSIGVYTRPEFLTSERRVLEILAERKAVALIVDGPYAPSTGVSVPAGLVVVQLPLPVGYFALNRLLAERALNQEVHVMRYSSHVHTSLASLLHRGAGMATLIREVSALASNPAVALDGRGHVVAHYGIDPTGLAAVSEALRESLNADRRACDRKETEVFEVETPNYGTWTCTASAIRMGRRFEGWVVVLARVPGPGLHDLAQHAVVTDQATAIIGSEMLRQRSVDEEKERARGDFVQALVHGNFSSEHDMYARADYHGVDLNSTFAVFVTTGLAPRRGSESDGEPGGLVRLARYVAALAPHPDIRSYITVIGDSVVVVRSIRARDHDLMEEEIDSYARAMATDIENRRGFRVAVAHGAAAVGADEIRESYRQSRVTLGISKRLGRTGSVSYRELRSYGVLELVADSDRGRSLIRDVLGPIRPGSDLYEALVAFLKTGGNINAAARDLDVHRNTMLSKLDRIKQILGIDVRGPENQFTMWLAIKLDMLTEVNASIEREVSYQQLVSDRIADS